MPVPDALPEGRALRLAVLASGEGTLLEALAGAIVGRRPAIELVLVLSDREGAPVLGRAARLGIPAETVGRPSAAPTAWSGRVAERLRASAADAVLLDGFRSVVPPELVARWRGRMVNVHPSLLPKFGGPGFYGERVHRAVLEAGERETGVTVHEVTEAVDAGPPLAVRRLSVPAGETPTGLRERLRPLEVDAILEALARLSGTLGVG